MSVSSSLFSKNVLERRSRFKNEKDETTKNLILPPNKSLPSYKKCGDFNIILETVSVKKEVLDCEPNELPPDSKVETENDNFVADMWLDEDKYKTVQNDQSENVVHSDEDIEIKYSYDETVPKVVDTFNKQVAYLDQQSRTTSVEELLKTVKMPVIHLKGLRPCVGRHSPKIVSVENERMKCEKGLEDSTSSGSYSENHCDVEQFQCPVCSKSFKSEFNMNRHRVKHSEERPFKCSFCPKAFKGSCNLSKHKKIHSEKRPHQCSLCEKAFRMLHHLKDHEKTHSGEKPFKCSFCSKSFTKASSLKHHTIRHSGETPYTCSCCSESFFTESDAKSHEIIHLAEKRHKCSFCEKRFKNSSDAKRHERIHTGERPYNSSVCEKSFKNSYAVTAHEIIHTKEETQYWVCSNCEEVFTQKFQFTLHECEHRETTEEFILS